MCSDSTVLGNKERNVHIFEGKSVDNAEELWDRVHLLASLWALVSKFQDSSFFFVHLNLGWGFEIGSYN